MHKYYILLIIHIGRIRAVVKFMFVCTQATYINVDGDGTVPVESAKVCQPYKFSGFQYVVAITVQ